LAAPPAVATWRKSSSETTGPIVAIDPSANDLIVIEDRQARRLHVLDSDPNHGSARVLGAIAVTSGQVYFTIWHGDLGSAVPSIWKVALAGGRASMVVDNAANPAISNDGKMLAFGAFAPPTRLVVRELATGLDRTAEVAGLGIIRWSPNGRSLAFSLHGGADGSFVRFVDVDETGLQFDERPNIRALGYPVWLDNNTILATDADGGGGNYPPLVVDVATLRATAVDGLPPFTVTDVSRSNGRLLGIVQQGSNAGDLQISRPDGQFETLGVSVSYAHWAD
jgi:hypothetical protein